MLNLVSSQTPTVTPTSVAPPTSDCPSALPSVNNGHLLALDHVADSQAVIVCNDGYSLADCSASHYVTCVAAGGAYSWSAVPQHCEQGKVSLASS